jgi:hypothetical protein
MSDVTAGGLDGQEGAAMKYTRQELIAICERAVVPEARWRNRDSASAQRGVGLAWAWLRAGCEFHFTTDPKSDDRTIWIEIHAKGFGFFDWGGDKDDELVYLPTPQRLDAAGGGDWY